jgi:hypothetical protein
MTTPNNLPAALAARDTARAKHAADAEALERGRERLAATQTDIDRLAAEDAAAVERHARRLEQQTREGKGGAVPQLIPTDKHLASEVAARRTHAAAVQMVANLEAAENGSRQVLAGAEQRVTEARNALKRAEVDRIAERIAQLRAEEHTLCARLAAVDLDARGCLTALGHEALASPPGRPTAQSLLGGRLLSDLHSSPAGNRQALEAARAYWRDFDATPPQPPPAAEERAA